MNTLIAYATKYGSVEKCANLLSKKLKGNVELCNLAVTKTKDLSNYENVIIAGSIYAGKIQKSVSEFIVTNYKQLQQKEIGLYVCGMLEDQAEVEIKNAFPPELLERAVVKEFFGGELHFQKINLMERFMVKMVSKMDKKRIPKDTTKDLSMISAEAIDRFAQGMNKLK